MSARVRSLAAAGCLILLAGVTVLSAGCFTPAELNTWPISEPETERLPGDITLLGPLVDWQWKESTVQWGVRPLFTVRNYYDIPAGERAQYDVPFFAPAAVLTPGSRLAPPRSKPGEGKSALQVLALLNLFRHESCGPESRTYFRPFYANYQGADEDGATHYNWVFFPLLFGGHTTERGDYFAVFPLGGVLKNLLGTDEIRFVLWPLYTHTSSGGRESYYVPFPLVNYSTGGGRSRWFVWPLIGRFKQGDNPPRWFFLWPFFWYTEPPGETEREASSGGVWPLLGWEKKADMRRWYFVWPLFSYARNEKRPRTDFVFFPFVRVGSGENYSRFALWPFYNTMDDGGIHHRYVLWPFYRTEIQESEHSRMLGFASLFYESRRREYEGSDGEWRSDSRNIFWPLWYYQRDEYANSYFYMLNLRVKPDPQGLDRMLDPLWRIYEHDERAGWPGPPGNRWLSTRALWSMFRWDRDAEASYLRVFPLFTSRRRAGSPEGFDVLAGLFGYRDRPGKRTYTVLFIPWTVDRGDGT